MTDITVRLKLVFHKERWMPNRHRIPAPPTCLTIKAKYYPWTFLK